MKLQKTCVVSIALLTCTALLSADEPAAKPVIPPLMVGAKEGPKSFVVNGVIRLDANHKLGFQVATDGKRQRSVIFDPADGTPLILSDGFQTLVYDLANGQVVRVPNSRGRVRIDWEAGKEKPLSFGFGVSLKSNVEKLEEDNPWFRIDQFVAAVPELRPAGDKNRDHFIAKRLNGSIETIDVREGGGFRFTSRSGEKDYVGLELDATHIDQPTPEETLAFPDPAKFPADLKWLDLDKQLMPKFLVMLKDGRAWMAKMALIGPPDMRHGAEAVLRGVDWEAMAKTDAALGKNYREALRAQGIDLAEKRPTTQPVGK